MPKLHPDTIPEMEVVDDANMTSNFTLRAKRPSTAKSRNRYKNTEGSDEKLSENMRMFNVSWRVAREREIKALIIEELRRTYITLAENDEQCKELNIVLSSLADGKGSNKCICEYLRERLRSSFLLCPEEVVLCRPRSGVSLANLSRSASSNSAGSEPVSTTSPVVDAATDEPKEDGTLEGSLPGTVLALDSGGGRASSATNSPRTGEGESSSDAVYTAAPNDNTRCPVPVINRLLPHLSGTILRVNNDGSVRESLDDGQITRKRFRHELARALRTRDEDPCVLVFIQTEKPSTFARRDNGEPDTEKDLFDVNSFCKKYGDLAGFARTTAISESKGIIALVNFLREGNQKNRASRGLALITAAPKEKRTDNPVALIESVEDFMSVFTSAESKELQCDVSRISRIDASKFLKQALLKRFELLEASQDPSITFEPQNLLVLSDLCAFLTVTSGGADGGHTFDTRDNTSAFIAGSPSSVRSVIHTHQTSGNEINLYALFPGWHVGQNLSVKELVLQWLVAFLQVLHFFKCR